jgi:hypothetical protein
LGDRAEEQWRACGVIAFAPNTTALGRVVLTMPRCIEVCCVDHNPQRPTRA